MSRLLNPPKWLEEVLAAKDAEIAALKSRVTRYDELATRDADRIAALKAQVTRLQADSTAELLKHREERDGLREEVGSLRERLKYLSAELGHIEKQEAPDDRPA